MTDSGDRDRRPGGKPDGQRPDRKGPARGAPQGDRGPRRDGYRSDRAGSDSAGSDRTGSDRARADGAGSDRARSDRGRPERGGTGRGRPGDNRPNEKRVWTRDGKPARGDRSASQRETPEDRDPYGTKSVRSRHDDPEIPEDVTPNQLDRVARAQLKTLSKENAEGVANHLVMVARLIESDPDLAYKHAVSAARRAGRIAVVRETLAITAYTIGDFAMALRELRTYRRISGLNDQLPMMVDSERGLGRPDKALELGRSVPRESLPADVQVELAIAMSGARLDLGQTDAALVELQVPQLDPNTAYSYSAALFSAYAAVLEDLGRNADAEEWYRRADVAAEAWNPDQNEDSVEVFEEEIAHAPDVHDIADAQDTVDAPDAADADGSVADDSEVEPEAEPEDTARDET